MSDRTIELDEIRDLGTSFLIRRKGRLKLRLAEGASMENMLYYGSRDTGYNGVVPRIRDAQRRLADFRRDPKENPYPHVSVEDAISAYQYGEKKSRELRHVKLLAAIRGKIILGLLRRLETSVVYEPDFLYVNDGVITCIICGSTKEHEGGNRILDHVEGHCIFPEEVSFDFQLKL